jgi:phthalate 4,5-cis-dihydrodiol dehydrogenase
MAGQWDASMETKGNAAALIGFESGAFASISLNGYGYFDGSELTFGIGSMGEMRVRSAPRARRGPLSESEKYAEANEAVTRRQGPAQPFFGLTIVSCERGVMRQSPRGILVYTDGGCEEIEVAPHAGRAAELIELRDAVRDDRDVFPNGEWGKATLATCLAILRSANEGVDVRPESQ